MLLGTVPALLLLQAATNMRLYLSHCFLEKITGKLQSGGIFRGFSGEPVVGTWPSNEGGASSFRGWGAKIPHASWPKNQNIKIRSNSVTNSIKTFKIVRIKKKKKNL